MGKLAELNGKIYGTTRQGGSINEGVLFEYNPVLSNVQIKLSLNFFATGTELTLSNSNNSLYGLSYSGGSFGNGMLSTYNPGNNTLTPKYEFPNSSLAKYPGGSLVSRDSKVYGFAVSESQPGGVIFEFNTQTQQFTKIFDFKSYGDISSSLYGTPADIQIRGNKIFGHRGRSIVEFNLDNRVAQNLVLMNDDDLDPNSGIFSILIQNDEAVGTCSPIAVLSEVIEFNQGVKKSGHLVSADRSIPENALNFSDASDSYSGEFRFVSLGFGGSIVLGFDQPLCNKEGIDLNLVEISYGNPSFYDYPEQAEFFVSQDGISWVSLGTTDPHDPELGCGAKIDKAFDIEPSGFAWIKYVKVVDVTDPFAKRRDTNTCGELSSFAFNNAADGFDLDAVERIRTLVPSNNTARSKQENGISMINIDAAHSKALLFPNPVSNHLVIDLSEEVEMVITSDDLTFEIVDMNGNILMKSIDSIDDTWTIKHDVTTLNNGLYVARITSGNVRRHYKFLKN